MIELISVKFGLSSADFLAVCGIVLTALSLLVAVLERWSPKKEAPNDREIREPLPPTPTPPAKEIEDVDLHFPSGLMILDYEPGVRLTIREYGISSVQLSILLPALGLSLGIALVIGAATDIIIGLPAALIFAVAAFRYSRKGARVHLNLQKRMFFVSRPGSSSGGGWPPKVDRGVKQEGDSDKWTTSLYLAGVCILAVETSNPAAGKAKMRQFENALRKICAQPQPDQVSRWDMLVEILFYA